MDARRSSLTTLEVVFFAGVTAEVAIGRVVTRGLEKTPGFVRGEPQRLVPAPWFVALDYLSLFLLYFAALVGVALLAVRAAQIAREWSEGSAIDRADRAVGIGAIGGLTISAVIAAVFDPAFAQWGLHASLGLLAIHQVARAWLRRTELGAAFGLTFAAAPIVGYCLASLFSTQLWNYDQLAGGEVSAWLGRWGNTGLVVAATLSPYCLAPRPLVRTITRVTPFACALVVSGIVSLLLRARFAATLAASDRALGIDLRSSAGPDQVALYVLALGTVVWTIAACLTAPSPSRRRIGVGLAVWALAGWGFAWPLSFVAAGVALVLIGTGAMSVRAEERGTPRPVTPSIPDEVWQEYIGHVVAALRRPDGAPASAVTMRGDDDHVATIIVTERRGLPIKVRIDRVARSVAAVDIAVGRDGDLRSPATWSAVARERGAGAPPLEPVVAGPVVTAGDGPFDARFRCRGDREALLGVLDEPARARAAAMVDGWLGYWERETLRHRVTPGAGAPVDQLIPLTALAGADVTPASAERLVAVIELCADLAARGMPGDRAAANDSSSGMEEAS